MYRSDTGDQGRPRYGPDGSPTNHNEDERRDEDIRRRIEKNPEIVKPLKRPEHQFDFVLVLISAIVACSVGYAMHTILPGGGAEHFGQVVIYGIAAALFSLFGNKVSIHKAAVLAARRDVATIVGVVAWFIAFGVMVGTLAFTGMSFKIVQAALLRDAGREIGIAARNVNRASITAKRVIPAIQSGRSDIQSIVSCEQIRGCISGRSGSGREVSKLRQIVQKYDLLLRQYKVADRKRRRFADALGQLGADYERVLNTPHSSWSEKRAALLKIYAKAQRIATEIENVIPTTAATGFVSQLRNLQVSKAKPGRIDLGRQLASNADRLQDALGGLQQSALTMPAFPAPPGIAAGWQKFDQTWLLAIFAYLLEIVVFYLWFNVYRQYRAYYDYLRLANAAQPFEADSRLKVINPSPSPSSQADRKSNGFARSAPDLNSAPIDGPHGWSGRSRFNQNRLDDDREAGS